MHLYLGQLIDLAPGTEHPLPWYPPLCDVANTASDPELDSYFPSSLTRDGLDVSIREASLRRHLTKYVSEGHNMVEAEIGQRILTAINKVIICQQALSLLSYFHWQQFHIHMILLQGVGPGWLLQTIASLYWRIRGNSRNAMNCLRMALTSAPREFHDVVLVSLGSLLHKLGYLNEALRAASDALAINTVEVGGKHYKLQQIVCIFT